MYDGASGCQWHPIHTIQRCWANHDQFWRLMLLKNECYGDLMLDPQMRDIICLRWNWELTEWGGCLLYWALVVSNPDQSPLIEGQSFLPPPHYSPLRWICFDVALSFAFSITSHSLPFGRLILSKQSNSWQDSPFLFHQRMQTDCTWMWLVHCVHTSTSISSCGRTLLACTHAHTTWQWLRCC